MENFFTWAMLGTYAGAVLATSLITQFFKEMSFIARIPTRVFSYFVALVVLLGAAYFGCCWSLADGVLCLFNAVIVSLAANGGYDTVTGIKQRDNNK
ncbi:MAG: hypothetical protein VB051_08215 [Candidatus Pelethousia sp.]|nr:hypothetical protein [Candidatus Pelethousia sp.]